MASSLLDRLFGRPEPPKAAKAVTSLGPWANGIPLSSQLNTPQQKATAYLRAYRVGWFSKAGRRIAGDVSSLDWSISQGDQEEGDTQTEIDRPSMNIPWERLDPIGQLMRLLEAPYRADDGKVLMTGRQLLHKTTVHLDFTGNACWYLGGGYLPTSILPINPARMWPSRDKQGNLIGWVMDRDKPSGGVPFNTDEILWFTTGGDEDDVWGTSVIECVYTQVPLTDQMARHTSTVLSTGGRLAGMMWPKERALSEDEFADAQRAWRNVMSNGDAGKRLLIFPEPMEYAAGASTPAEIGIPELATLNRDEILTAFPISPYMLGVPTPGGLNSGEVRREDRRDYWEGTVQPRADLVEETVQVGLLTRYERVMNATFDFELEIPRLDDAPVLLEKAAAYKGLISIGLDPKEALDAVGLAHIKWLGLPDLLDPAKQAAAAAAAQEPVDDGSRVVVRDDTPRDNTSTQQTVVGKYIKTREEITDEHVVNIAAFLEKQAERTVDAIRKSYPAAKAERVAWVKADPDWWDASAENAALREVVAQLYVDAGRSSLQVVADSLGRIVRSKSVQRVIDDLMTYGGERIVDINARTLQAITMELAEGSRRGYTVAQLIDGVPAEGFKGVLNVGLDNGVGVWGDLRAETIARTETALSYNRAALRGYDEFNVKRVLAYDGDSDPDCAARNGREFSISEALDQFDHPNGTLDWAPVVDKSYREPQTITVQPTFNLTLPPPETHVQVAQPDVKVFNEITNPPSVVNVGETHVTAPEVTVNVPKQDPPVVNVEGPVMKAADVTVNVPKQEPPVIHVEAPVMKSPEVKVFNEAPVVTVNVPDRPAPIVQVPAAKTTTKSVKRDKQGRITEIVETPDGE